MPDFQASFYLHATLVSSPKESITLASNRGEKRSTTIVISQVQQARVLLLHFIFFLNLVLPPLPTLLLPSGIRLRKEFIDGIKARSSLLFHGVSSAFGSSAIGGCFFFLLVVEQLLRLGFLIRVSHGAAAPYHVFEPKNGRRRFPERTSTLPERQKAKQILSYGCKSTKPYVSSPRNNPPPKQQQTKNNAPEIDNIKLQTPAKQNDSTNYAHQTLKRKQALQTHGKTRDHLRR